MTKLTLVQQRALYNGLPKTRKMAIKKMCKKCQMEGDGIKDIVKKVKGLLGPLVDKFGPQVMKEIVLPFINKEVGEKMGKGLSVAGSGLSVAGGALRLAGQGKKKSTSPWILHVKKVSKDKGISYKEAMKIAKQTYKK